MAYRKFVYLDVRWNFAGTRASQQRFIQMFHFYSEMVNAALKGRISVIYMCGIQLLDQIRYEGNPCGL